MILSNKEYRIILDAIIREEKYYQGKYEKMEELGAHDIALSINNYLGEILFVKHKIKQGSK